MQPLLWDTHTAIWIVEKMPIAQAAVDIIAAAHHARVPSYVSPITAWEIGMLASRGRLQLLIRPERWFANLSELQGVKIADLSPDLLIASSFLPGHPPNDPSDRIIAATARELGATLVTRDRVLLDYGEQGHISVVGC